VPLPTGETILKQKGHFYALFPFARGRQIPRGHLATSEVIAMGRFLGELHRVLHGYPHEQVPHRSFTVDEAATLASIDTIEAAIRSQFHIDDDDRQVLSRLAERRAWLMTTPPINTEEFSQLEQQVIHGDYQETNLFFEGGQISAIIDWDQSYVAPRAWEIVRTLHYAFKLEPAACHTFLHAYRRVLPLTTTELDVAAIAYGWKRGHDLWHYEELYLKGNQRVRAFFQSKGAFIPFEEKWKKLQHSLLES
jgi:Ser/Thr protein kinase RdoA (MazF antagonist)